MTMKSLTVSPLMKNTVQAAVTLTEGKNTLEPLVMIVSVERKWEKNSWDDGYTLSERFNLSMDDYTSGDNDDWTTGHHLKRYVADCMGDMPQEDLDRHPLVLLWQAANLALAMHYPMPPKPEVKTELEM
jgi:hypothetical protein